MQKEENLNCSTALDFQPVICLSLVDDLFATQQYVLGFIVTEGSLINLLQTFQKYGKQIF